MNKNCGLYLFSFLFSVIIVNGQNNTENLQGYTPSVLISKKQTEFKMFNNLYTQTHYFDNNSSLLSAGERSTYFTSITELNYGISSNVTLGGELWFKSVKIGNQRESPTKVLSFTNSKMSRTAVSALGMKVKFNPIKKWNKFSVQSSLLINVIKDPESINLDQPFLDNNRHQWVTKFYYDKMIGEKFQIFSQVSTWVSIDKELGMEDMGVAVPLDLFVSYFATNKLTVYVQNQIWPSVGEKGLNSYFIQEGLGVKYQLFSGVEIEGLFTGFVYGENTGAGQTYNLGLRILN